MRWAGHVARMGEKRNTYRLLVGKPEERSHWEDQDVGGWIILGWILWRWNRMMWTGLVWLRIGAGGELLWIRYWIFGFFSISWNSVSSLSVPLLERLTSIKYLIHLFCRCVICNFARLSALRCSNAHFMQHKGYSLDKPKLIFLATYIVQNK
jgi:hypothetical protein